MSWNHGNFYGTTTLTGITNLTFLDTINDEVVEEKFILKFKKIKTGFFKSEEIPEKLFVLTNYQIIDFEHDRSLDYTIFRIPYEEILGLDFVDAERTNLKITIGDNRGSITRNLNGFSQEIFELLKGKTSL